MKVIKRNGNVEDFNKEKIEVAIRKALVETKECEQEDIGYLSKLIAKDVCNELDEEYIEIEDIQDLVEFKLMDRNLKNTAKAYILYRNERNRMREIHPLDESILGLLDSTNQEVIRENANKKSDLESTKRDLIAGEISKHIVRTRILPKDIVEAHDKGVIHVHDMDYAIQNISNCIEQNAWIYIKDENGIKYIQLKDLDKMYDIKNGINEMKQKIYVLGRAGWTRLKAVSKRDANENIITFRTRTGLKLKTTENHRIPVIRNEEEILVLAKDIEKKDILLTATGMKLNPYEFSSNDFVNLLEIEDENLELYIINIKPLKDYIKYKYQKDIFDILEEERYCLRGLHINQFKKILEKIDIPYEVFFKLRIKAKNSRHSFPLILPLNESFAKIYGYVYADGGVYVNEEQSTYHLTFTNTNLELIKDCQKCFKDVFDEEPNIIAPSGNSPCYRLCIGSRLIVSVFKKFCEGKFNGSSDISIPNFIMNGSDEIKLAFLSAIMDCDGCLGNDCISYISCSEKYSEQIIQILKSLNIHASMNKKDSAGSKYSFKHYNGLRNYDSYKIQINRKSEIYDLYDKMSTFKRNELYDNYESEKSLPFIESKIFDIKIKEEETVVYDLQTVSGWFVVNDYVVHNCELIPLDDMFEEGTVINKKMIRTPKSLRTASTLATQIAQSVSSVTYGGQTMSLSHLAPYVRVSKEKIHKEVIEEMYEVGCEYTEEQIQGIVNKRLKKEIKDAVQTFNYQLNTLNSSNGQSPFLSLAMYLDEKPEYKEETAMLIEEFLKQRIEGMENEFGVKTTQTFPKLLFFLDEDNMYPDSPYYYLKELAIKSTSIRMNPDFISVKRMKQLYNGNVFPCMGCRSFLSVWHNENGESQFYGRGNVGVCTINLPYIALLSNKDEKLFWEELDKYLEMCKKIGIWRYEKLKGVKAKVAPILWQYGVFSRLDPEDEIYPIVKEKFTVSLGYSGIYEVVKYMKNVSHTTDEGFTFALKLMKYLESKVNEWKKETGYMFGLYGTPQESTGGVFAEKIKKEFGEIKDITDKGFVTNSYHVDVREEVDAFTKLKLEGKLQEHSLGGCVSYIETYNMSKNLKALEQVVDFIYENVTYGEINFESDICGECSYNGSMEYDLKEEKWICPQCGNDNQNTLSVVRRVCGYLGEGIFSKGRVLDILNRVKHL